MTGLDVLEMCLSGEREIDALRQSIETRRMMLERCTQQLTGMPHGGTGDQDKIGRVMAEVIDLEHDLEERKRAYGAESCAAVWLVELLPLKERTAMTCKYLKRMTRGQICISMGYSESQVKRIISSGEALAAEIDMATLTGYFPEWYERKYFEEADDESC